MKPYIRSAVVLMCFGWLLSLLGCGKTADPVIRDKTGMVRQIPWSEFTISQTSDVYEGNIGYTVKKEKDGYYLVLGGEYPDFEERRILLSQAAVDALLAMELGLFPDRKAPGDDEPLMLDGTTQSLTVVDENGERMPKDISKAEFDRIVEILNKCMK